MSKKPNHYFDNDLVTEWIVEYLSYKPENRKRYEKPYQLREKILWEVGKIVNGIIFTQKFTIWEPYDDLYQEAMEACTKALEKFNPYFVTSKGEYATAFNYFSLTAKRCLKFYTIRNQKNRKNHQIEDYQHFLTEDLDITESSKSLVSDSFINQLKKVFENQGHTKYIPLIDILEEYLNKIGDYNKRDFFRFAKFNGWSPNLIRKFLKILNENKEEFYNMYNN
jgi:hypothetical protein